MKEAINEIIDCEKIRKAGDALFDCLRRLDLNPIEHALSLKFAASAAEDALKETVGDLSFVSDKLLDLAEKSINEVREG